MKCFTRNKVPKVKFQIVLIPKRMGMKEGEGSTSDKIKEKTHLILNIPCNACVMISNFFESEIK